MCKLYAKKNGPRKSGQMFDFQDKIELKMIKKM